MSRTSCRKEATLAVKIVYHPFTGVGDKEKEMA